MMRKLRGLPTLIALRQPRRRRVLQRRRDLLRHTPAYETLETRALLAVDLVRIAVANAGAEAGELQGTFTVSQTAALATDTVISLFVLGTASPDTDYTALPTSVTIPANSTSATINVAVIDDDLLEGPETVFVTLTGITSGDPNLALDTSADRVSLTIADDDTALVSIVKTNDASESGPVNGVFTLTQSAVSPSATVIAYDVNGTATADSDYVVLGGTVTIPAGATSATITVPTLGDSIVEADETVVVTLSSITSGHQQVALDVNNLAATLSIADDDAAVVGIVATNGGSETGPIDGAFTVTQTAVSSTDTVVNYSVSGTAISGSDYTDLSGTVTIPAGQTTATITVSIVDDALLEDPESVVVQLMGFASGQAQVQLDAAHSQAEIQITDDEVPRLAIVGSENAEEGSPLVGVFTVTQSLATTTNTIVAYTIAGTATSGADYTPLAGTATIPAGETSVTIVISVVDDGAIEGTETVVLTLGTITSGDARLVVDSAAAQATIDVLDNDSSLVSIAKTTDGNEATPAAAIFTVTQTAVSASNTVLAYTVTGSATAGSDYTAPSGAVTIVAGQRTATITVPVLGDALVEANETILVTLTAITSGNPLISLNPAQNAASASILDNDLALVSIAATGDGNESGPIPGSFLLTQSAISSTDTIVNYTIGGVASHGSDYETLSGFVTIPAGQTSATIDVLVIDDDTIDGAETVTLTISSIAGDEQITADPAANSATLSIADNETNFVSIVLTTDGRESGPTSGRFTVSQSVAVQTDTVIALLARGTATAGSDYVVLPLSVTIPAGSTSATVDVQVLDDTLLEGLETVRLDLDGIISGDPVAAIENAARLAFMNIADDDVALVSIAKTADANEAGPSGGRFTLTLSALSPTDTVVEYFLNGTAGPGSDYAELSGFVTIPAGQTSATIDVLPLDDALVEADETVEVLLNSIIDGHPQISFDTNNQVATLGIADDDAALVGIVATSGGSETGPTHGRFTVTQSAVSSTDTVVNYTVNGTAAAGIDYTTLSGAVTIPAGETTAAISVPVFDDGLLEELETVIVHLDSVAAGNLQIQVDAAQSQAQIQITDNEIPQLSLSSGGSVTEGVTAPVSITVLQSLPTTSDTVLSYTVTGTATSGADFTTLSGTVTILAGATSATIELSVVDDNTIEGAESIIITLGPITSGDARLAIVPTASQSTIEIVDNDTGLISVAKSTDASEVGPSVGVFTVTQSAAAANDTILQYSVAGTATSGVDYTALSGTVTIPAGQTSATISVLTLGDAVVEGDETLTLTLDEIISSPAALEIDPAHEQAAMTLIDDDVALVRVALTTAGSEAGSAAAVFTVTQSAASATDTIVNYSVSGTAASPGDYVAPSGTVMIPAGQMTATIVVPIFDDALAEGAETLNVTLTGLTGAPAPITIDPAATSVTSEIADNDLAQVRVTKQADGSEAGQAAVFVISLTTASSNATTVLFTLGGTATAGADYTAPLGSVTVFSGQTSAAITIPVLNDAAFEGAETLTIHLDSLSSANANVSFDPAQQQAVANIADDETGLIGIATTTNGSEVGPTPGRFTITQGGTTAVDTIVAYTVGGTATAGSDFTALSGTVTIPAGQTSATIDVAILDDQAVEGSQTLIVTLSQITSGSVGLSLDPARTTATLAIADNDNGLVGVAATTGGNEAGPIAGVFAVTQSGTSDIATVVSYTVGGTATAGSDYTTLSGTVTIPAGQTSATIDVAVLNDNLVEGQESVIVTLTSVNGSPLIALDTAQSTATLQIADNDTGQVTVAATTAASEAGTVSGRFTIAQSAPSNVPTVVSYTIGGTATSGGDFAVLSGTATIPAGQTSVTVDFAPIDDTRVEGAETVTLAITTLNGNPSITLGAANSASAQIVDNDSATVAFAAATSTVIEATGTQTVVVRLSIPGGGTLDRPVTVNIADPHSGTATATDYTLTTTSVTFAAGSQDGATQNVVLSILADGVLETTDETIVLNLAIGGDGLGGQVSVGAVGAHTVTINDDPLSGIISGIVWADGNGNQVRDTGELAIPGVTVRLTGTDARGQAIDRTTTTSDVGAYSFANLAAGTYTITERQPVAFSDGLEKLGTVAGVASGQAGADTFTGVTLMPTQQAIDYNFGEAGLRAKYVNALYFLTSTSIATLQRTVAQTEPATSNSASAAPSRANTASSALVANAAASSAVVASAGAIGATASVEASAPDSSAAAERESVSRAASRESQVATVAAVRSEAYAASAVASSAVASMMTEFASAAIATPSVVATSIAAEPQAPNALSSAALDDTADWESNSLASAIDPFALAVASSAAASSAHSPAAASHPAIPQSTVVTASREAAADSQRAMLVDASEHALWGSDSSDATEQLVDQALENEAFWLDEDEIEAF